MLTASGDKLVLVAETDCSFANCVGLRTLGGSAIFATEGFDCFKHIFSAGGV